MRGRSAQLRNLTQLSTYRIFGGVRFQLTELKVETEPIGLQLAFPIASYDGNSDDNFFAKISLEKGDDVIQSETVPRVRPIQVLARSCWFLATAKRWRQRSSATIQEKVRRARVTTAAPKPSIAGLRRPYLQISDLHRCKLGDLRSLAADYDGVHLYTNVASGKVLVDDTDIDAVELFKQLDGLGLDLLYLDTCNSVQVVSSFRETDIKSHGRCHGELVRKLRRSI